MTTALPLQVQDEGRKAVDFSAGGLSASTLSRVAREPAHEGAAAAPPCTLDDEISRAEAAYQLMLVADTCLRAGADQLLVLLGFSQQHVEELRQQAGRRGGYPAYAMRNIKQTLRFLRRIREQRVDHN